MKTTVNQRFESMIELLGLTKNAFAKAIGVASTQIYNICPKEGSNKGRNAPSYDMLSKIALKFPTVNLNWLISGEGQPLISSKADGAEGISMLGKIKDLEGKIADLQSKVTEKEEMNEKTVMKVLKKLTSTKA